MIIEYQQSPQSMCALLCAVGGHWVSASLLLQHSSGVPPMKLETRPMG
eukprot:COSAG06_NODE_638_length_13527_cov_7.606196_12_plen_48_part_00